MALVGLLRRHSLCKICIAFDDETLNALTKDIILRQKSYREIREYYTRLLPPGVKPINDVNISNHRRHSDPILFAKQHLEEKDIPVTAGDMVEKLYAERFHETINKTLLLNEAYRQRLDNLEFTRKLRKKKQEDLVLAQAALDALPLDPAVRLDAIKTCHALENSIIGLGSLVSDEMAALQDLAIRHTKMEMIAESKKEQERYRELILHAAIALMDISGRKFLAALSKYLMDEVFSERKEVAHQIIIRIGRLMDLNLKPAINSDSLIDEFKKIETMKETPVKVISSTVPVQQMSTQE